MQLEDHVGDILRKARAMSRVTAADAARAAGLSLADYTALEESGIVSSSVDWAALAQRVGLHPEKLERIARGWLPAQPDLSRWRHLRVFTGAEGGMAVNFYLIWDEESREAALFDTGWDARPALTEIARQGLNLRFLLITHGHTDHIAALDQVRGAFPRVQIHQGGAAEATGRGPAFNADLGPGRLRITTRPTPGHAADGVSYLVENWPGNAPPVAVVGDAIFAGSMGRGNQSWELARRAVREQLLTLPPDTLLCPGHGPLTTVAEERANNPFF